MIGSESCRIVPVSNLRPDLAVRFATRGPLTRAVACALCGAAPLKPCIVQVGKRAGIVMEFHHIHRAAVAHPDIISSMPDTLPEDGFVDQSHLAPRFNPFRAWLQDPMLYGASFTLVMAVFATVIGMYDPQDRLWIDEALAVGGIAALGVSCGWYAHMKGCWKLMWANRVASASAFAIGVAPVIGALV